jgi:hypothetical protein
MQNTETKGRYTGVIVQAIFKDKGPFCKFDATSKTLDMNKN